MKYRILYKSDETIAVIIPGLNSRKGGETEEDWLNRVFTRTCEKTDYLEYEDIDPVNLPSREYRNAWRGTKATGIKVDQVIKQQLDDEKERTILISEKKDALAIEELKKEGKLDAEGNLQK